MFSLSFLSRAAAVTNDIVKGLTEEELEEEVLHALDHSVYEAESKFSRLLCRRRGFPEVSTKEENHPQRTNPRSLRPSAVACSDVSSEMEINMTECFFVFSFFW